jgi:hypothetical protein
MRSAVDGSRAVAFRWQAIAFALVALADHDLPTKDGSPVAV